MSFHAWWTDQGVAACGVVYYFDREGNEVPCYSVSTTKETKLGFSDVTYIGEVEKFSRNSLQRVISLRRLNQNY